MDMLYLMALLTAIGVFIYLIIVLFFPERFL